MTPAPSGGGAGVGARQRAPRMTRRARAAQRARETCWRARGTRRGTHRWRPTGPRHPLCPSTGRRPALRLASPPSVSQAVRARQRRRCRLRSRAATPGPLLAWWGSGPSDWSSTCSAARRGPHASECRRQRPMRWPGLTPPRPRRRARRMGESLLEHAQSAQLWPVTGEDVGAMAATLGLHLPAEARALFLARLACYIHPPAGDNPAATPLLVPLRVPLTLVSSLRSLPPIAPFTPPPPRRRAAGGDGGGGAVLRRGRVLPRVASPPPGPLGPCHGPRVPRLPRPRCVVPGGAALEPQAADPPSAPCRAC